LFIKKSEQIGKLRVKSVEHVVYKIKELLVLSLSPPGTVLDESDSLASVECDLITLNTDNIGSNELKNTPTPGLSRNPSPTNLTVNSLNKSSSYDSLANLSDTNNQTSFPVSPSQNKISPKNESINPVTPQSQRKQFFTTATTSSNNSSDNNKFEKKIFEEIVKIFQDNNGSFYFSYTYDLTNSIERMQEQLEEMKLKKEANENVAKPLWKCVDERFFWNKALLSDLVDLDATNINRNEVDNIYFKNEQNNIVDEQLKIRDRFILPLIQGFIQIESFISPETDVGDVEVRISLISRRSRYRLGTRFKKRGVDENGNVANFVETEQVSIFFENIFKSFRKVDFFLIMKLTLLFFPKIIDVYGHSLSFVILRGSIPIFWSQPG